ncbi:MAG: 30S ribosomal protein S10 [Candidatus Bilamarchaeaceae archaeon]
MAKMRIKLSGEDPTALEGVVSQIRELAKTLGLNFIGPVRLPRRRFTVTVRRTPCGDGSDTYEHWEKRFHKRLIEVEGSDKYMKQLLKVKVPTNVFVKISLS